MTALVEQLTQLRRNFPQLRPRHWVEGRRPDGSFGVIWLTPRGTEMTQSDWNFPDGHFLSYVLASNDPGHPYLYILLNAAPEPIEHLFPTLPRGKHWKPELDTTRDISGSETFAAGAKRKVPARSVLVFSSTA
jgi:glycogen operon protein